MQSEFGVNCASLKLRSQLLSFSGRMQWLEEQLRCERAFNEDLKARLHDLEAQNEGDASSDSKSCDCDNKQINKKSHETVVRQPLVCCWCFHSRSEGVMFSVMSVCVFIC